VDSLGYAEVRTMATSSADSLTRRAGSRIFCPAAESATTAGHEVAGTPFPVRARRSSHRGAHRIGIFGRQVRAGDGARRRSPPRRAAASPPVAEAEVPGLSLFLFSYAHMHIPCTVHEVEVYLHMRSIRTHTHTHTHT
jgi:hypothetical protein